MNFNLIMENWRKFLAEQPAIMTGPEGESLGGDDYWEIYKKSLRPRHRERLETMEKECNDGSVPGYCREVEIQKRIAKEQNKRRNASDTDSGAINTAREMVKTIFLMLDPTGQVGDIDFDTGETTSSYTLLKRDVASFENNPTLLGAGVVALGALAMIPIVGKIPKFATKTTNIIKKAADVSKHLKKSGDPKLIAKSKEIDSTLKKLKFYQETMSRGMTLELVSKLKKLARGNKAVNYNGEAFRGIKGDSFVDLVDQLNIPGVKKRTPMDYMKAERGKPGDSLPISKTDLHFRKQFQKAWNSKGKWVEIDLPKQKMTLNTDRHGGTASFTTDFKVAEEFSKKHRGDFDFIIVSDIKGIDVPGTLNKNKIPVDPKFAKEKEVLPLTSNVVIKKILIKRK